jgi:hypothetical protein
MRLTWLWFLGYSSSLLSWRSLELAKYVLEVLKYKQYNAQIVS